MQPRHLRERNNNDYASTLISVTIVLVVIVPLRGVSCTRRITSQRLIFCPCYRTILLPYTQSAVDNQRHGDAMRKC